MILSKNQLIGIIVALMLTIVASIVYNGRNAVKAVEVCGGYEQRIERLEEMAH